MQARILIRKAASNDHLLVRWEEDLQTPKTPHKSDSF